MHGLLIERRFDCPHCGEPVSVSVDLSVEGEQQYIEDCEVCCQPIRFRVSVEGAELRDFHAERSD